MSFISANEKNYKRYNGPHGRFYPIQSNPFCTSKEIHTELNQVGYATTKRLLQQLIAENLITVEGRGKSTKYKPSNSYELLHPM